MIALMDTSHCLSVCSKELGMQTGQLLTPLTRYRYRGGLYAIDNGAFSNFNEKSFLSLLKRQSNHKDNCKFVCCPDVVGQAAKTMELFDKWQPKLKADGWPVALVAQDGLENLSIPWDRLDAIFIGGSTDWKLSQAAIDICIEARSRGKWVHIGRVNSAIRVDRFMDYADSFDGSGISRYSWMRKSIRQGLELFKGVL